MQGHMASKWPIWDLVLDMTLDDTLEKHGQVKSMSMYYWVLSILDKNIEGILFSNKRIKVATLKRWLKSEVCDTELMFSNFFENGTKSLSV